MLRMLSRLAPALLWAGVIFTFSAQPDPPRPTALLFELFLRGQVPFDALAMLDYALRKAAHFTEYAILAVLVHHALGLAPDRQTLPGMDRPDGRQLPAPRAPGW